MMRAKYKSQKINAKFQSMFLALIKKLGLVINSFESLEWVTHVLIKHRFRVFPEASSRQKK